MAENTTVNKVVINNETVIDITDTTATPDTVAQGQVFYKASGERAVGNRTFVTGVKGDSESTYRTGNVNITKANIGLGNVENKSSSTIRSELTKSNVTTALGFTPYTPAEVDALVSAVFHYKGTKATYAEVAALTGMKVGDVWLVTADNSEYVYNGSTWEKLGPTIDLSGYLTSVSIAGQTLTPSSNTITAAQLKTALGLESAAYKDVETTVANDAKLPTGAAVKSFVEGKGYTTNTGTVTKVSTGVGLTGGDITGTGTVKAKLKSETASTLDSAAMGSTANKQYAVGVDKSGYLSVNIPWSDTKYTAASAAPSAIGTAAVGTSEKYAREDHVHSIALASGDSNGQVKIAGTNVSVKGWNTAATYAVETAVANDTKLPTGAAVKTFVEGKGYTTNTGTVTKVSTGVGLTGGDVTTSGTIKAKLKSETASTLDSSTMGSTASRQYAVGVDKSGYLSVNIPWENTQTLTGVKGNSESSYRTGNVNITAANIGLGNVENKSSATIRGELTKANVTDALGYTPPTTDTDTKNTAGSTDTSSKIFLIGATSQAANPQTYSDNEVYATNGVLTTKSVQVGGTAATMQYNSTTNAIDFIFA